MTRPLTLAEAMTHPSIERVIALMRATDERGRVLVHEAAARCLAVYAPAALDDRARPASGDHSGVVLAFPASLPPRPSTAGAQHDKARKDLRPLQGIQ